STSRKRYKRPGYMRGERQPDNSHDEDEEEEEEEGCGVLRNGKSGRHASNANDLSNSVLHKNMFSSPISTHSTMNCNGTLNNMNSPILKSDKTIPKSPSSENPFNSSFSFIQQSLNCSQDFNTAPEPLNDTMMIASLSIDQSNHQNHVYSLPSEKEDHKFWRDGLWSPKRGGVTGSDLPDIDARSVDTEITSSLSVDSDTASASSVTSGYESATPVSTEQGWESLVKKYDGVLHECLQNNRTHTKIESMMLKLQRLQQKAIQEDDYDAAERFGKKLEELCRERGALRLGLPSRQPTVAQFLQRLSLVVNGALQRTECAAQHRSELYHTIFKIYNVFILILIVMMISLCNISMCFLVKTSQQQFLIYPSIHPSISHPSLPFSPQSSLPLCFQVVMSQRLGSSLRRRVSETETQLLALQEAKLAAISGNDFGSAKELKAEMRAVNQERDRLEGLTRRLQTLSSSSSEELRRLKEQRGQLRQERESRQAQHGESPSRDTLV
uniref:DISC1 scaffold protein n=1 Tax=Periophthalmus magnuspinnatus TaxID=409849 RepID=A0A3B4AP38_9GOBI